MSKIKELKLAFRIEVARQELKRAAADLVLRADTANSAAAALAKATKILQATQAFVAAGTVPTTKAADAMLATAKEWSKCAVVKEALDAALVRYTAAEANAKRLQEEALAA